MQGKHDGQNDQHFVSGHFQDGHNVLVGWDFVPALSVALKIMKYLNIFIYDLD